MSAACEHGIIIAEAIGLWLVAMWFGVAAIVVIGGTFAIYSNIRDQRRDDATRRILRAKE
jgi:hypothetical protein